MQKVTQLASRVLRSRWAILVAIPLVCAGYVLLEQLALQESASTVPGVRCGVLSPGLVRPILAWLMLTCATIVARKDAGSQEEWAHYSQDLTETSRAILDKIGEITDIDAGRIWTVRGERLVPRADFGVSSDFAEAVRILELDRCLCSRCAQTGETLAIDNLDADASLIDSPCAREGFQSILTVPMKTNRQVVGVIHVARRHKSAFDSRDQQLLSALGQQIAPGIEHAQLYEAVSRRVLLLETAALAGQQLTALSNLNQQLEQVVKLIQERFNYHQVHILLIDEEVGELVLREASGPSAELMKERGLRLKVGQEGITGWVAQTGQALLCNDVRREPRFHEEELLPETRSELAVPLRIQERVLGVLDVQSDRCGAFDEDDLTILQILANQVAITIQDAGLFREIRHRWEAMVALHETSLDVLAQLDVSELLEALLTRGAHLLGARVGAFYVYNAKSGMVRNVANYNTSRDWAGTTLRPGQGLIGSVILTGKPLVVNDYENWSGRVERFAGIPNTRMVGVPLRSRNQIIGGIVVANPAQARLFDHNDAWLLSLFADLASIAIRNAELHTRVEELNRRLEQKVEERTRELAEATDEITAQAEQLRSLLVGITRVQDKERARIANDMHDGVVQLITAVRYELQAAKVALASGLAAAVQEKLNAARDVLEEMDEEIRRVIYDLYPPILDVEGLVSALQKHVSRFQEVSGVACQVQVKGNPYQLPSPLKIAVFRVVEEALYNIACHAKAETASVALDFRPAMLCVIVQDDGRGFRYERWAGTCDGKHWGLPGMKERIESHGGKMEVWSKPGHGTRVSFWLPIQWDGT